MTDEDIIIDGGGGSDDPQKSLIPASNSEISLVISAEANYDRWANFLFPHTKTADDLAKRRVSKPIPVNLPNGEKGEGRIEVIPPVDGKCYTSKSYEVYLAIVSIWRDQGMSDEPILVSLSQIARKLDLKPSGRVLKLILMELKTLSRTTTSWIFSFTTVEVSGSSLSDKRVLDTFEYTEKKDRISGLSSETKCKIRLSEHIRKNIQNNITIPVNFTARKSIKSDVARTIYSRIDSILISHKRLENSATYIVDEYFLTKKRYQYKSQRKGLVELITRNLNGVETSRPGVFLVVSYEETADGRDWKCIFSTTGSAKAALVKKNTLPTVNKDKDFQEYLVSEIEAVMKGGHENKALYAEFARKYSENHIRRAIGEYKELVAVNPSIENRKAYFTALMHTVAHKLGKEWIKPCDKNCKYRPESQLFPD